jgi:hypothetical protein
LRSLAFVGLGSVVHGSACLCFAQRAPSPRLQLKFAELEATDGDADEAEGGEADGGGHAADLAVLAFDEGEFEPGGGDGLALADGWDAGRMGWHGIEHAGLAGERREVGKLDAAAELFEGGFSGDAFDLGVVGAFVGVLWLKQEFIPAGFIAEEKEAFGVGIEASHGIDVFWETEFGEHAVGGVLLGELGEDAVWLVEGEEHERGKKLKWESKKLKSDSRSL